MAKYTSQSVEAMKDSHADIESPRIHNEGFFSSIKSLVEMSEVVELESIAKPETTSDGTIYRYGAGTNDGYARSVLLGLPHKQTNDKLTMATTAWWTSTEGHNERTARNVMRYGSVILMVGAEGSWHNMSYVLPKQPITLASSASSLLSIAQELTIENNLPVDTKERLCSLANHEVQWLVWVY